MPVSSGDWVLDQKAGSPTDARGALTKVIKNHLFVVYANRKKALNFKYRITRLLTRYFRLLSAAGLCRKAVVIW